MPRSAPIEPLAVPLTDGVVSVRHRRHSDVEAIASASHDPLTRRWLTDDPMDAEARASSMARVDQTWRSGQAAPLVVADAATDEPVGLVNLQFRDDAEATVAYSVFPAHRGRGVAPRAVQLVTGWAFTGLGVARLLLEADEGNTASIRVAYKCGFTPVGSRSEQQRDGAQRTVMVFTRSEP